MTLSPLELAAITLVVDERKRQRRAASYIARHIGRSPGTVCAVETRKWPITLKMLNDYAESLGYRVNIEFVDMAGK